MTLASLFHPAVAAWFARSFAGPTPAQEEAWPAIQAGRHVLLAAPTGSGKTLAAFLAAIDDLVKQGLAGTLEDQTQIVYVSPLKALSNDIKKNLELPLAGIREELAARGLPDVAIRTLVRTGDTPQSERAAMRKLAPHILVTTPESLYVLLGSGSGRQMLAGAKSVIVDEIHAVAPNKRGSHLALTLERLEALCGGHLQRIGLSATQKPIELVANFLIGARPKAKCTIIDTGHRRARDLQVEIPSSPLEAVMAGDVWGEVYDRLAQLIEAHRTTLVFVNTRRMAERATRALSERVGADNIAAHHGSLAKERRLDAEQRLKAGKLKALVATASLELGIDIGDVDLVCQIGSPRAIATFLQRVGRSGHAVEGTPKGRLFPLSRDELVECAALLDAVRRGELDRLSVPELALDVVAQQIVAETAAQEWSEEGLFALIRRAWPFRALPREDFLALLRMLAEGFSTRRGRRGALIHYDAVNHRVLGRRGARITALTSGGTIPDNADYQVLLEPENQIIGTVNEDFAVESLAGDVFQLGNTAYRIRRVERGTVRVEDAEGQPPNVPFWLGEAPGRSDELSAAVSRLRAEMERRLSPSPAQSGASIARAHQNGASAMRQGERVADAERRPGEGTSAENLPPQAPTPTLPSPGSTRGSRGRESDASAEDGWGQSAQKPLGADEAHETGSALTWLTNTVGLEDGAARQILEYLAAAKAALGALPTLDTLVFERFFDSVGGMQLVIHSPYGSRLNRAWGLALRKRFCTRFNFELQAAATEDNIVLSLTTAHSFDLAEVKNYLHPNTVRGVLIEALLDAPMFTTRWRWVAGVALALPRFRGGKKVPPPLARMDAEDLLASIFPDQLACAENLVGAREIPDHPLVRQTIEDCLTEAMDVAGLERLLARLHAGEIEVVARDLAEPSPLALEVLSARPYAYLDDAPLEERRTQAVMGRRWLAPEDAADLGKLDPEAIARVREEAWPDAANPDELHDALVWLGFLSPAEIAARENWRDWLSQLAQDRRATRLRLPPESPSPALRERVADAERRPGEGISNQTANRPLTPTLSPGAGEGVNRAAAPENPPLQAGEGGEPRSGERVGAEILPQASGASVWITAERLPQFLALFPNATLDPPITAPSGYNEKNWPPEEALVEILRGRLEGLGPVTEAALAAPLGLAPSDIAAALAALQSEGFALRGRFTPGIDPGIDQEEWCERRLLARIHRYTLKRLRAEIEPVAARDFLRFLFEWQRVTQQSRMEGPDALAAVLGQLEGFEAAAGAWETEILAARVAEYEPAWLDDHCLAGRTAWARLRPRNPRPDGERGISPVRTTPITFLARRNAPLWSALSPAPDPAQASPRARAVMAIIEEHGASFFDELAEGSGLLKPQVEEALGELVALGLVTSDSFAGMRALIIPDDKRRSRRRRAVFGMEDAGRWALARRSRTPPDATEAVEHLARTLLRRYGVVFWRLLEREAAWLPPWRDLLRVYRRLEARGEIRGGRFVAGFAGEQYALPDAIGMLREIRRKPPSGEWISLSGADPLNLVGILTPGAKLAALTGNRILYRDGLPVALFAGGQAQFLETLDPETEWQAKKALRRGAVPASLIALS